MIMEAEKFHDLWSVSYRPKRDNSSSSLKAGRLETQEELMFQFNSEGRKKPNVPAQRPSCRKSSLLLSLCVVFKPLLPTLERTNLLTESTESNVNLIQKHQNNV